MDLWVIVGAAAAGYIARYWQNISRNGDSLPKLFSKESNFENPELPSGPFGRLVQRKKLDEDVSTDRRKLADQGYADMCEQGGGSAVDVASTSEFKGEKLGSSEKYENCDLLSLSTLTSIFLPSENLKGNDFESRLSGDIGDNYCNPSIDEIGSFCGSVRTKSSLRTKNSHRHFIRPLNSLESCLMAQLHQKHTKMEEYVLPSPVTPTTRSLFVTNGSQIISRASGEFFKTINRTDDYEPHKEAYLEKNENLLGVSPLPQIGSPDFPKKVKLKSGKWQFGRLSNSSKFSDGSYINSQGSHDGKFLFCVGISIGIISSFMSNRREVEKLKDLLKQTENLVQDLQEELEMKDSLTVKELANENNESLATCGNSIGDGMPNSSHQVQNMSNLAKHDDGELYDEKEENIESMGQIEAELEAELERMGLNMNSSSLERNLSEFVELDLDFEVAFAQGELRTDMLDRSAIEHPESNRDASGTSTHRTGNYAVSPRELSLRLHEVIQSRLEERVQELEMALENSQRKVQLMESNHEIAWRNLSNTELRYSSDKESREECNSIIEPLIMNLSGEALDAYNEAYEELTKINESEEDSLPSQVYVNNHQVGLHPFDRSLYVGENVRINGSLPHITGDKEKTSNTYYYRQRTASDDHISGVQELLDAGMSGDENSDDEMEKQLIKQIVEKTKKGSPVVLNAQKWLFLMNEHEHVH